MCADHHANHVISRVGLSGGSKAWGREGAWRLSAIRSWFYQSCLHDKTSIKTLDPGTQLTFWVMTHQCTGKMIYPDFMSKETVFAICMLNISSFCCSLSVPITIKYNPQCKHYPVFYFRRINPPKHIWQNPQRGAPPFLQEAYHTSPTQLSYSTLSLNSQEKKVLVPETNSGLQAFTPFK